MQHLRRTLVDRIVAPVQMKLHGGQCGQMHLRVQHAHVGRKHLHRAHRDAAMPDYARAHRWLRAHAPFTPTNGLLTANGRLRRSALQAHYATEINA